MRLSVFGAGLLAVAVSTGPASAAVVISEWMYDGSEFIEFTNTGPAAVNFAGWSFDDSTRTFGSLSLSGFGTVASGEAVLVSQDTPAAFRATWGLPETVKVIQNIGADNLLQRGDEINLYNSDDDLADRLTYADNGAAGGPRTNNASGNIAPANFGTNNAPLATLSAIGDAYGSYSVTAGTNTVIGNPGNVPEPTGLAALAIAGMIGLRRRRVAV